MKQRDPAATAWLKRQVALGRRAALPAIAYGLGAVPLAIVQAWIVARLLGAVLLGMQPKGILADAIVFAVCALARAWLGLRGESASVAASGRARHGLRQEILARLLAAGPARLRGRHSGALASLAVDQVELLDGLFGRWIPAETLAVAAPLVIVLAVLSTDRFAGLILLGAGLLVPVAMAFAGIGAARAAQQQFQSLSRLQTRFLDRVRGIATIVLAGRADDEAAALAVAAADLRRRTMRVLRVAFLSSTALDLAMAAALVLIAVHEGGRMLQAHAPHPARGLFALLLVPDFFAPLRAYAAAYADRMQGRNAAGAMTALPEPEPAASPADRPIRMIEASGVSVSFEHVSLTWDPDRGKALDDVSFRVLAGETLIVAGPSGAGKSSLIELLLGFARPDSGTIALNGMKIETIVPAALSRMTAWIGQRPLLFAGTLRENIRFGRPEASDADVTEAATRARLGALIESLPDGLDTRVGESGFGLSGGQAQRVVIARAFLRNAPMLLLDEPTAHLDPVTEAEVLESLKRLAVGRTVLLVTHSAAAQGFPGRRIDLRHGRLVGSAARGTARGAA
jgi:ATP-binding cassette subfamily C protein CydD